MGKFIGLIAATLDQTDGGFVQTTELLDFLAEIWVYYCRPQLGPPREGWRDLAGGTLRVSFTPPPYRHDVLEWTPQTAPDDAGGWQYTAEVMGVEPGNNLFHLALPPATLPRPDSWDVPPLYGHADDGRFVLGWRIAGEQWPTFRFAPVAPGEFAVRATELERAIGQATRARRQELLNPYLPPDEVDPVPLLGKLQRLSLEEVRTLVFELGVDYGELAGETKTGKLRELLLYLQRQDQLPRLLAHLEWHYAYLLRE